MAANHTLLFIHRDPAQLSLLNYELSLVPGAAVAAEMKKVKPQVPIIMLTDHLQLTDGTLESADALVTKSDGPHFLWATIHFSSKGGRGIKRRHVCVARQVMGGVERPPTNPAQISK